MDLAPYPSPDELHSRLHTLSQQPGVTLHRYGESAQGRDLYALVFSSQPHSEPSPHRAAVPKVMLAANIHGLEWIGSYVALAAAESLQEPNSVLAKLRSKAEIWVFPRLNPDAYAQTWEQKGLGSIGSMRCNARGVDLNRNFVRPTASRRRFLPGAGSSDPKNATYIGKSALSEAESRNLFKLLQAIPFRAALNLHSFGGALIHAHVSQRSDYQNYRRLHRAYLSPKTGPHFFRLGARFFDTFTGELEDCQHHIFGTWASCLELFAWHESWRQSRSIAQDSQSPALSSFWRFNPRDPMLHARRELPRIAAYFLRSLELDPPQQRFELQQSHDWPQAQRNLGID